MFIVYIRLTVHNVISSWITIKETLLQDFNKLWNIYLRDVTIYIPIYVTYLNISLHYSYLLILKGLSYLMLWSMHKISCFDNIFFVKSYFGWYYLLSKNDFEKKKRIFLKRYFLIFIFNFKSKCKCKYFGYKYDCHCYSMYLSESKMRWSFQGPKQIIDRLVILLQITLS